MDKKFTEEQYKKITDCFDKLNDKYNMGILNTNVMSYVEHELFDELDFIEDWQEIVAIMNPITRDESKEKFVEKEKKYVWRYKKTDEDGYSYYLYDDFGIITLEMGECCYMPFAEKEVIEAGYNPDMFDREEVE